MKILVTGGGGNTSKHLRNFLPSADYIERKDANLLKYEEVYDVLNNKYDIVVHTAAKVGNMYDNMTYPVNYFEENIMINTNVIRAAHETKVKHVIALSSSCAFPGIAQHYPMSEDALHSGAAHESNFAYAYSKRAMTTHIDSYIKQYGYEWCVLYLCNLYSEHEECTPKSHFLNSFIYRIIEAKNNNDKDIILYGSGKAFRQFVYSDDIARAITSIIDKGIYTHFNIAPIENLSIIEIARIALAACGQEHLNIISDLSKGDGQIKKNISNEKFMSYFPEFKFTSLFDGIKKVYNHLTS